MNACLISCAYYNLPEEYNGRIARKNHYLESLKTISHTEAPLHLYINPCEHDEMRNYIKKDNIIYKCQNLNELPIYNKIAEIKKTSYLEKQRCYEIMYSKTFWLREVIKSTNYDYYFWIDAGLSYSGLFPHRLRTNPNSTNAYDMYYNYKVFNNTLINNIINQCGEKLWCICFDQKIKTWAAYAPQKFFTNKLPLHMVGGMFGGKKDKILNFCDSFDKLLDQMLSENILLTEEQIYTVLVCNNIDDYKINYFNCWYHENQSPGLYENWIKNLSEVKEFYKIFTFEQ